MLSLLQPMEPPPDGAREISPDTLRRAQAGEAGALRAFVETYQDRVSRLVGRMLHARDPTMVQDICQECFLRALRALRRFDPAGPARLSTWLLTIATRLCLDHLRRDRPTGPIPEDAAVAPVAEDRVLAVHVEAALATLAPDLRATLVLRVVAQLSVAETAAVLGVDEGTVKSRLSRARARLREALGGTT